MNELDYVLPVRSPNDGIKAFIEEFEAMYEAGGFQMSVLHSFPTGRLARWQEMERHLERIVEQGDVWLVAMKEIAEHAKVKGASLRRDTLDFQVTAAVSGSKSVYCRIHEGGVEVMAIIGRQDAEQWLCSLCDTALPWRLIRCENDRLCNTWFYT